MAVACVIAEDDLFFYPRGGDAGRIDRVNRHKGAGIGGIGHHAHDQTVVGDGGGPVHERGLQCVNRNGGIEFRRDGDVVGAGSAVEVEGTYTGETGGVDVWSDTGIGVDSAPAERI